MENKQINRLTFDLVQYEDQRVCVDYVIVAGNVRYTFGEEYGPFVSPSLLERKLNNLLRHLSTLNEMPYPPTIRLQSRAMPDPLQRPLPLTLASGVSDAES